MSLIVLSIIDYYLFIYFFLLLKGVTQGDYTPMEDSEETSQSLQIELGPLQSDQQTASSQDGQGKGDDVIVIDSDDEEEEEDENDGEHEVNLI